MPHPKASAPKPMCGKVRNKIKTKEGRKERGERENGKGEGSPEKTAPLSK